MADATPHHVDLACHRLSDAAILPVRSTSRSAGLDLFAPMGLDTTIAPGERALVKTNVRIDLPPSTYGQIAPRSGLAYRSGIAVLGGIIDEDYEGDVGVILHNTGDEPFRVTGGNRIAQLLVLPVVYARPSWREVHMADRTAVEVSSGSQRRGSGGFGSTGQ